MKKLAIGCGVVLLLLAAAGVFLYLSWPKITKRATGWFEKQVAEQRVLAQFEDAWKPPAPQLDETWFPAEVNGWKRETATAIHEISELNLTRDGYSAAYARDGQRIELKVIPVTDLETEGLIARTAAFKPLPENNGRMVMTTTRGRFRETTFGDRERLATRTIGGWFLLLHTLDGADVRAFADAWLHAIDQAPPAVEPAMPKSRND